MALDREAHELEDMVFQQDAMLGQRNIAIEQIRFQLGDQATEVRTEQLRLELLDLLLNPLPLDELYDRLHRDDGWPVS